MQLASIVCHFALLMPVYGAAINIPDFTNTVACPSQHPEKPFNSPDDAITYIQDSFLVLTQDLITRDFLIQLGLGWMAALGEKVENMQNHSIENLLFLQNSSSMLVFNTSESRLIPTNSTRGDIAQFIYHSIPFTLPTFHCLAEYYMVIPNSYIMANNPEYSRSSHEDARRATDVKVAKKFKDQVPWRHLDTSRPTLILIINGGSSIRDTVKTPFMGTKDCLPVNGDGSSIDAFFDTLADSWAGKLGITPLLHSVFCTIQMGHTDHSFCVQLSKDNTEISLTHAFAQAPTDEFAKQTVELYRPKLNPKLIAGKFLGRINGARTALVPEVNELETSFGAMARNSEVNVFKRQHREYPFWEDATIPLAMVQAVETKVSSPRNKSYSQVLIDPDTEISLIRRNGKSPKTVQKREQAKARTDASTECAKVTWYNLFHHSVFGKPTNFCV
ncbi:hypothetical protein BABINDRAFT_163652 [Babjeviella inositovora NRRL Y-12698]|uniref:Uncharacterized protein n=1 Tax=Babjeviella inositovora NRRL Y-12698 TaxID=984486 RepID=A0A1E3QK81_9ASCO|nr:uncharacterized protein BABINDRAFT_163652 [Babjeviella inositovora NRRL Y-12698]ODQ77407.1 hypothetical protein BABINDRAFT_163652 [Babjeviella inositovora NRRL Y-12698]